MINLTTRLAKDSDARAIADLHVKGWLSTYRGYVPDNLLDSLSVDAREKMWRELISQNTKIFLLEENNRLLGFVCICRARDLDLDAKNCGEISAIYLHPNFQRQGLGTKLMDKAFTELKDMQLNEVVLWVLKENLPAQKFYEKMGFSKTKIAKEVPYADIMLLQIRYYKKISAE